MKSERWIATLFALLGTSLAYAVPVTMVVGPLPVSTSSGSAISVSVTVTATTGSIAPKGTILVETQVPHERCSVRLGAGNGNSASAACSLLLYTTVTRQLSVQFLGDVGWDDASLPTPRTVSVTAAGFPTFGFQASASPAVGFPTEFSAPAGMIVPPTGPMTLTFGGGSCIIVNYLRDRSCKLIPLNADSQIVQLSYPGDAHYAPVSGQMVGSASFNGASPVLSVPASVTVSESAGTLVIPVTQLSGNVALGRFRTRILNQTATVGDDFTDADFAYTLDRDIEISIVRDQRIEATKTAQVEIYDVQGASFDRSIINVTLTDDDTVAGQTFVVTSAAIQNDGCAVNGCSFNEAIQAANASAGADRIEFNLPSPGAVVVQANTFSNGDLVIDGRMQNGYVASTNLIGVPNGTMGVELTLNSAVQFNGKTEFYGVAMRGNGPIDIRPQGETRIQGCFLGTDRFGAASAANTQFLQIGFSASSANVQLGGALASERNILSTATIGSFASFPTPGLRMQGNWVGQGKNGVLTGGVVEFSTRALQIRDNDFFNLLSLRNDELETGPSNRLVKNNRFSGPGGLQLIRIPAARIGGSSDAEANRFFALTPPANAANRQANITLDESIADLRGNIMGGNPGRPILFERTRLGTGQAMLRESNDDPFDIDSYTGSGITQRFQNAPEIMSVNRSGNTINLSYRVNSMPGYAQYPLSIEFFQAEDDEGKALIARDSYTESDAMTVKNLSFTLPANVVFANTDVVIATATDSDGQSSNYSRYPMRVRITQASPDSSATGELITVGAEFTALGPVVPFGKMLVGFRGSVANETPNVFIDTPSHYCRSNLQTGVNSATAVCIGTNTGALATNPNAIFASLSVDVPFALQIDQQDHTVRLPSADLSFGPDAATLANLIDGIDACEAKSFIVSARNAGPDSGTFQISLPRPTSGVLADWRYTCTSSSTICGAISTGTTSLAASATLAPNQQLDLRIDVRSVQTPRGSIAMSGNVQLQSPASDPNPANNGFGFNMPVLLFENGFESNPVLRLCIAP